MHRAFPKTHIAPRAIQRAADEFNSRHPIGTPVLVTFERAERPGEILSPAVIIRDGERVTAECRVAFVGIAGRFDINRVRRAPSPAAA